MLMNAKDAAAIKAIMERIYRERAAYRRMIRGAGTQVQGTGVQKMEFGKQSPRPASPVDINI
jgi:hypothetical protein